MNHLRWVNKQDDAEDYLSDLDRERLTSYKWRYSLETHGFDRAQAARLFFLQYRFPALVAEDRVEADHA
jgi:hypothetical protein